MRSLSIRQTLAPVLGRDADNAKELLHMLSDALALQGVDGGTLACYDGSRRVLAVQWVAAHRHDEKPFRSADSSARSRARCG